ncbi:MAG: DUF3313 family protein [Planctomycetota bacterium]|nr:DUF3313 family protein [Planctomycetota bacterium]
MKSMFLRSVVLAFVLSAVLFACQGGGNNTNDVLREGVLMQSWPGDVQNQALGQLWTLPGTDWNSYTQFQLSPVTIDPAGSTGVSLNDQVLLTTFLTSDLSKVFMRNSGQADQGSANMLAINAHIVQATPNKPLRNITPLTQLRGAGYGSITVEYQITDSATGTLLAAMRMTEKTQRFSVEKLSVWGSAEESMKSWNQTLAVGCGKPPSIDE